MFAVGICLGVGAEYSAAQSQIDYEAAAERYNNLCAGCHGASGDSLFPNQSSFTSAEDLVNAYGTIGTHGSVEECDTDCGEINPNAIILTRYRAHSEQVDGVKI